MKHYRDEHGDDLFVRNVFEVRRMVYTIYNALGDEPDAWRDDKPLRKIYTEIPPEYEPYTGRFWPWRESEITEQGLQIIGKKVILSTNGFLPDGERLGYGGDRRTTL